jgi:hypothetical protein
MSIIPQRLAKIEAAARAAAKCAAQIGAKYGMPCPMCIATLAIRWAEYEAALRSGGK